MKTVSGQKRKKTTEHKCIQEQPRRGPMFFFSNELAWDCAEDPKISYLKNLIRKHTSRKAEFFAISQVNSASEGLKVPITK